MTVKALVKLLDTEPKEDVLAAIEALKQDYDRPGGLQIVEVAGGYQIVTRPELHEWVRRLFHERTTQKLSVASLETLAVIAYKQPVTAPEIAEIRGVNTAGVLGTLDRAQARQDRRPQAGRRPAVHVRHHARVPRALRPERPHRPAEGRGHVGAARLRPAGVPSASPAPQTALPFAKRQPRRRMEESGEAGDPVDYEDCRGLGNSRANHQ